MENNLYLKDRYIAPYDYLINKEIKEYDMEKANISILREYNLITQKQYEIFKSYPRQKREITIGYLIRDNKIIREGLIEGFKEARKEFFTVNKLDIHNILYIDKDSITTIDTMIKKTKLTKYINFRMKNQYSSFYRIFLIDFLYYNDKRIEWYRLKNTNENIKYKHKNGILDLLLNIFYMAQYSDIEEVIYLIKDLYIKYTHKQLPLKYYREFNTTSKFRINTEFNTYLVDNIENLDNIDIGFNASLLQLLYKIYTKEYFKRN